MTKREQERERLVVANQGLVFKVAKPFAKVHPIDDLVQEGNMGLLRAIEKFDPARGVKFANFAAYWVRAFVWRFVHQQTIVHTDRNRVEVRSVSLDAPAGDGGETFLDAMPAADEPIDDAVARRDLSEKVRRQLHLLKARLGGLAGAVVEERLLREDRSTLDDLAARFGKSRERVRQVELQVRELLARRLAHLVEVEA